MPSRREGRRLPGGNGLAFDWRLPAGPGLAAPLDAPRRADARERLALAIQVDNARQVDISSGVEIAPGVKDEGMIRAFCKAARA